jgi:hypothetical protein
MSDIDALVARLEAAEAKLKEHEQVIAIVGCTDPKNMEADRASREFFSGVIVLGRAAKIVGFIGKIALGVAGGFVALVAIITQLKGG